MSDVGLDGLDWMDGLSYTAVTPRASLQSDAKRKALPLSSKEVKLVQDNINGKLSFSMKVKDVQEGKF